MAQGNDPMQQPMMRAAMGAGDVFVGVPQRSVFAILGYFVPDTSVLHSVRFQHLLTAKFLADAGRDAVRYAAIVTVVANGGGAMGASIIGLAALIPGTLFSLYGGAISDSLPKRIALTAVYGLDVALCFLMPLLFGDSMLMLFMLVFLVTALTQIASPAEQTLLPLVTTTEQLAGANSMMGLVSSVGTAFGTAFLAPILLKLYGSEAVFFVSGLLLLGAMTRVAQVNVTGDVGSDRFVRPRPNLRKAVGWLRDHPSISTMVGVSAVSGMGYSIVGMLAPTYVADVLDQDPANTVFIMGVAGAGMMGSLFIVPSLVRMSGERGVAAAGFVLLAGGLLCLGLVELGALEFLTPFNPFHWVNQVFPFNVNERTEIAMLVSLPVGVGAGLTDNSVKTYLNRRVPIAYQGRTFAMRNLTQSALTIPPLLAVSAVAQVLGISVVLFVMPVVLYSVSVALLRVSAALGDDPDPTHRGVLETFWEASDEEIIGPMSGDDEDDSRSDAAGRGRGGPAPGGPGPDAPAPAAT